MQLQTERLILKELNLLDLNVVHELNSSPEVDEYNTLGIPESIHTTEVYLQEFLEQQVTEPRKHFTLSIRLIETDQFIGLIALNLGKPKFKTAEVWYKVLPVFWRKGYTTEVLVKLLEFGFNELKLHRIEAGCAVENIASIKVLEKAGMIREGSKRKVLPIRGSWVDNYFYAILETELIKHESSFL
jgi:ribosomal-protein-alanine N-acetyltransferase